MSRAQNIFNYLKGNQGKFLCDDCLTKVLNLPNRAHIQMITSAFGLCKENKLPIVVFNINQPGATTRVLAGERVGTIVR